MIKKVTTITAGLCLTVGLALTSFASGGIGYTRLTFGDINNDGYINQTDVNLLDGYLKTNQPLTNEQKVAADVDEDVTLTQQDFDALSNYVKRVTGDYKSIGKYYYVNFGDVDLNGYLTQGDFTFLDSHLRYGTPMSIRQLSAADVNRDGSVNSIDLAVLRIYTK